MKTLLILGAGTAGTMVANKMTHQLDPLEWKIIIVDQNETHYYQPGFLFIPFDIYGPSDVVKPKRDFIPQNVEFIYSEIELIEPDENRVTLKALDSVWLVGEADYDVQLHEFETTLVGVRWFANEKL